MRVASGHYAKKQLASRSALVRCGHQARFRTRERLGGEGLREYEAYEGYSLGDAGRMLCATDRTVVARPLYGPPESPYHSRYGFNWRRLRARVAATLKLEATIFSPLPASRGWLSSQAWFVCRPLRPRTTAGAAGNLC